MLLVRAPQASKRRTSQRPLSTLEQRLVERGVSPRSAVQLVREFPAAQIQQKIEAFDTLSSQRGGGTLRNPAGFLVQSIRNNYLPSRGVQRPRDRHGARANSPGMRRGSQSAHTETTVPHAMFYVEHSPFAEYLAELTTSQRSALEEHALANARGLAADGYRRALKSGHGQLAQHYRQVILEQHLRETRRAHAA